MSSLEKHFSSFRDKIVGIDKTFLSPYGEKKIVYADWIASGRLYLPIEYPPPSSPNNLPNPPTR